MKPTLRQRPWARIVVGLVCVLSLTLLAACGSQVVILAQGGAFRPSGAHHMQRHVAQDLTVQYTRDVANAYSVNTPLTGDVANTYDVNTPLTGLNDIIEDQNFFYTIQDKNDNVLASGGTEGASQATWSETIQISDGLDVQTVRQTFDSERKMQDFLNNLYENYDDVEVMEETATEDVTESTYYVLVAQCTTYGTERTVTVNGALRSDLIDEGYAYETLNNLATLLAYQTPLVAGTIFGGVLALLCLLFLLWPDPVWLGVEEETDEAGDLPGLCRRRPWLDRAVPTDLLVIVAGIVLLCCAAALSDDLNYQFMPGNTIAAALVGSLVFLPTLCSLVRRGREGALGENLLFRRLLHPFGRFFRWMGGGIRETVQKLPLFWQAGLLFVGFGFLELLCLLGVWNNGAGMALLWLLLKVVELIFFIRLVLQLIHLQAGGQKLTQGDLNYQLPLEKLHGPFRAHGEALNSVRQGIQHAVEEQMKSERMKTELITNVSHDIKTPLTAIVSYVDLLKQEPMPNEKAKEYLDVLDRQSARLKKLTEDLVEASKATTGNLTVDLQPTDVNVFLGQTTGEYEERLAAKQLALCLTPAEGTPRISADGRLLWRVFENLFSNIQKYAQPGTRVYLTCQATDEQVTIIFRNISAEPLNISADELMERFVRGDASRNTEGSGLGLSIARSLTQLQHGTFALAVDGDLFKAILTFPRLRDGEG